MVVPEDVVLTMHRGWAQDVKKIVDRLRTSGRHEAVAHNRCYRPWSFHECLISGDRFQVRRIVVRPGHQFDMQKHYHRPEHWVVVQDTALATRDGEATLVRKNESIYLLIGAMHRVKNPGRIPLTLIEL